MRIEVVTARVSEIVLTIRWYKTNDQNSGAAKVQACIVLSSPATAAPVEHIFSRSGPPKQPHRVHNCLSVLFIYSHELIFGLVLELELGLAMLLVVSVIS